MTPARSVSPQTRTITFLGALVSTLRPLLLHNTAEGLCLPQGLHFGPQRLFENLGFSYYIENSIQWIFSRHCPKKTPFRVRAVKSSHPAAYQAATHNISCLSLNHCCSAQPQPCDCGVVFRLSNQVRNLGLMDSRGWGGFESQHSSSSSSNNTINTQRC